MSQVSVPALGSREEKKAFYKNTFRITLPIVLQNFMDAAVSSADVLMLTLVNQVSVAAANQASQVSFTVGNLMFGLSSAAAIMSAQYFGKGDKKTVEKVMGLSLRLAIVISLLFTPGRCHLPHPDHDPLFQGRRRHRRRENLFAGCMPFLCDGGLCPSIPQRDAQRGPGAD